MPDGDLTSSGTPRGASNYQGLEVLHGEIRYLKSLKLWIPVIGSSTAGSHWWISPGLMNEEQNVIKAEADTSEEVALCTQCKIKGSLSDTKPRTSHAQTLFLPSLKLSSMDFQGKSMPKLSPALAAVVGSEYMTCHDVVKKISAIIEERNLYDPKNKMFVICDEQMQKVFGRKRFRNWGIMRYLKDHFID